MKQGKCLDPKTLRQVCSLLLSDANKTAVQRKIGVSRITAANIWQRMMKADITSFQSLNRLDDTSLLNACYPQKSVWTAADDGIPQSLQVSRDGPDFKALALDKIHSHKHIQLYYFDYFEKCREGKTEALSRSQFYLRFKQALDALNLNSLAIYSIQLGSFRSGHLSPTVN